MNSIYFYTFLSIEYRGILDNFKSAGPLFKRIYPYFDLACLPPGVL